MCVDCLCGCDDLFVRRIEFSVTDIVPDRAGEQEVILRHDAHLLPEAFDGNFLYVVIVDQDMAGLDIVKAADQVESLGKAGAAFGGSLVTPSASEILDSVSRISKIRSAPAILVMIWL